MSRKNDVQQLIRNNQLRLQKLKEQQALYGISADPRLSIEIDGIEAEIDKLKAELETLGEEDGNFDDGAVPRFTQENPGGTSQPGTGNSGIIITGGTIHAEQLAVGWQAQASKNVSIINHDDVGNSLDTALLEWMKRVETKISELSDFDEDEKAELTQKATKIKDEAAKKEDVNINKLERWLNTLVVMAPDILDITVATLQHPLAGIGIVLKKINDKVKLERQSA
ncbi:MAG: hypothetical protein KDJ65_35955 [Anaerolineae bacterium]|nr:hypothetical protein [Anaerolineae bacterium]